MKDFDCKADSTRSGCDDRREMAFTQKMLKNCTDVTVGIHPVPKMKSSQTYIHNICELLLTWYHYPVYATRREDDGQNFF